MKLRVKANLKRTAIQNYLVYKSEDGKTLEFHVGEGKVQILVSKDHETLKIWEAKTEVIDGNTSESTSIAWVEKHLAKKLQAAITLYESL